MNFPNIHSPLEKLQDPILEKYQIQLFVKRDDLIHPEISGNKYRKLKYNISKLKEAGCKSILTFGGAYSNHIVATAAAANTFGLKSIGVIRGDEFRELNYSLKTANNNGMQLHFISREAYAQKQDVDFLKELKNKFGDFYLLPEGGANSLAVKGCAEIITELPEDFEFDIVCCACGTGTTLAGIYSALGVNKEVIGFSALKGGDFLKKEIANLLKDIKPLGENLSIETAYHFGGYAKIKQDLVDFCNWFYKMHHIPLDLIYTSKMFFGIYDKIRKGHFSQHSSILAIHTGGLQANQAMQERFDLHLQFS